MKRQRFARNQARPKLRQFPFGFGGEITVEMFGDDKLQDSVTEEFQPLIIEMASMRFVPQARVSERFRQQ
jgi:hypothetical protein